MQSAYNESFVAPSLSVHRIEIYYEKYKTIQISQ
ncbi:hypothetical protein FC748_08190 [Lysinibacillus tabacifolii]|uniref:Uncharacterized protein n=1 Tax=Lysinibacillus tabacifolii TaxID=1173107 RepID=A0ABY2T0N5_9BACI|nr:hypothetical protein FC748_08190 [Lysinibacillus tabacifolii]